MFITFQGYNIALVDLSESACSVYGEVSSIKKLLEELNSTELKMHFINVIWQIIKLQK